MRRAFTPLAGLLCVVASLAWLVLSGPAVQASFGAWSTHSTSDEGLSVARAYLAARGRSVSEMTLPFREAALTADATLLRIAPPLSRLSAWAREEREERRGEASGPSAGEGASGAEGASGVEGASGAAGASVGEGASGAAGASGVAGPAGAEGASGPAAPSGAEGEGAAGLEGPEQLEREWDRVLDEIADDDDWLTPDERAWVHAGGRLVLGLDAAHGSLDVVPVALAAVEPVHPAWHDVRRVLPEPARVLATEAGLARAHALVVSDGRPVAVSLPLGRGEVVVFAVPEVLRNDRIDLGDHLVLLERLAGADRAAVVFDERVHGLSSEPRVVTLLAAWGLGPAVLLLGLVLVLASWRRHVRIGPPDAEARDRRSVAVDLVESLATLYGEALSRRDALALGAESLAREVAMTEHLSGARLDARMTTLLKGWVPPARGVREGDIPAGAFQSGLGTLNRAWETFRARRR